MNFNTIKSLKGRAALPAAQLARPGGYNPSTLPFEELCAAITNMPQGARPGDIMVTGVATGVGASTIARNFAATLASGGEKVLLVSVIPSSGGNIAPLAGASDILALSRAEGPLSIAVVDSGRFPLSVPQSESFFSDLRRGFAGRFDRVVWDMQPVDVSPLTGTISNLVSGTILVVHAGHTRWHAARHHADKIRYAGGTLLGVVLNRKKSYIPGWIYRLLFR